MDPLKDDIIYFDLLSAKPLNVLSFVLFSDSPNNSFSDSTLAKISKASNIASFLVAAAFFNLSAASSSFGSGLIISSLATLIN